jgi:hypothetical protein
MNNLKYLPIKKMAVAAVMAHPVITGVVVSVVVLGGIVYLYHSQSPVKEEVDDSSTSKLQPQAHNPDLGTYTCLLLM